MREEKRFAVLIDADNVSVKYIKYILDEISNYGIITYKRIYGDWTNPCTSSWKEVLLNNSITPIQQYSYTTGKNSTDSAMIIDAMDILYSNNVEGFCLVSSDSDFTRLATRLKESGMLVIGMGEEKTPKAFSAACNSFKYLDILVEEDSKAENISNNEGNNEEYKIAPISQIKAKEVQNMTDISIIEDAMIKIITEFGDEEKGIDAGELGSRLGKRYPDFDVRNYGYTKLSKFLESFKSIGIEKEGRHITVYVKSKGLTIDAIEKTIVEIIKESNNEIINMGELNKKLKEKYPDFEVRNFGYSKFSRFINDLSNVKIKSSGPNGNIKRVVLYKH